MRPTKVEDAPSLFGRMGGVYKLLVDEESRRRREESMLLETAARARAAGVARSRPVGATRVLDLACGTGLHARILAQAGYRVTGLDASDSLLDEARRLSRGTGAIVFRHADLLEPFAVGRPASLALLLGNTLSLFRKPRDLKRVLGHTADALVPGGLLLCQILNFERLLCRGAVATVRHGTIDGRETALTKTLQPTDDGTVLIHLAAAQRVRPGGRWETFSQADTMAALAPATLRRAARALGFAPVAEWGDMAGGDFAPSSSSDFVCLFAKNSSPKKPSAAMQ